MWTIMLREKGTTEYMPTDHSDINGFIFRDLEHAKDILKASKLSFCGGSFKLFELVEVGK